MEIYDHIREEFNNPKLLDASPTNYCPNCWGRQEYGGAFFEAIKLEGIRTDNIEKKKGWIQAYAAKYLDGIQLKAKGSQLVCHQCSVRYEILQ